MTLNQHSRTAALERMTSPEPLDVLVIGAGVVGAGAALDAVTRGLSTGLIEARDYSSGTSSRSSAAAILAHDLPESRRMRIRRSASSSTPDFRPT